MGKRLSQLNQIEQATREDYMLLDGENFLESKKVKLKDINIENFNTTNFYNREQADEKFVSKTSVQQTYNAESENPQSGKAVAKAVDGRVPRKRLTDFGAPLDSVIAVDNGDYNHGDADGNGYGMPNDSSYKYINVIGDEFEKDIDNNGAFINSIPRRDSKGNLFTGTPVDNEDCVNKKYVDEKTTELDDKIDKRLPKLTPTWLSAFKRVLTLKAHTDANPDGTMSDNAYEYINVNDFGIKYDQSSAMNTLALRDNNGNLWTYTPVDDEDCVNKKYVDEKIAAIPSGGSETWEIISDTTTEFNTPVSQIVINQDTNGNSFSLKKMKVFIDFTVSETYSGGIARALTASSGLMYIVSQSFSAGTVYGYFIDSEVLPMVNNRCQIISHFNENRMSENGNNFDFEYNSGAVDYAIRTERVTVTKLGYNVSSISNLDFRLGSTGKINKARILIFGVRA